MNPMPLWLVLALISPLFWAIVHVLDAWCVDEVFDAPWIGVVCSAMTILMVLPLVVAWAFVAGAAPLTASSCGWCVLAGAAFMLGQAFYFEALSSSESGIVAAYWNILPLLLLAVSYLFCGERLRPPQYGGALLLVIGSVSFCAVDTHVQTRQRALGLMCAAAMAQVAYFMIQQSVFATTSVAVPLVVMTASMSAAGASPLLLPRFRSRFILNWPRIRPILRYLVAIEAANMAAIVTSQYAVSFGRASLVSSVEAAIPAYTFVVSLVLFRLFGKYGEPEAFQRLPAKAALVALMVVGVWLVS